MSTKVTVCGVAKLQRIADAKASGEERYFTVEDAKWIAYEASHGSMLRRIQRNAITGEWLVYVLHDAKNYYLCLGPTALMIRNCEGELIPFAARNLPSWGTFDRQQCDGEERDLKGPPSNAT